MLLRLDDLQSIQSSLVTSDMVCYEHAGVLVGGLALYVLHTGIVFCVVAV